MKKSFTLLELVFVIVVIGILAAVIIPRIGSNNLHKAAVQVVSHIKYTQHLAMIDDKFDTNDDNWFQDRWQLVFSNYHGEMFYWIFSDYIGASTGNPDASSSPIFYSEVATNPSSSNLFLIGSAHNNFFNSKTDRISKNLDLKNKYGISDVKFYGGSNSRAKRVMFDYLGRPIQGTTHGGNQMTTAVDGLVINKLYIKLCKDSCIGRADVANENEIIIVIEPETGYARII